MVLSLNHLSIQLTHQILSKFEKVNRCGKKDKWKKKQREKGWYIKTIKTKKSIKIPDKPYTLDDLREI